jgi:hypothetical protein
MCTASAENEPGERLVNEERRRAEHDPSRPQMDVEDFAAVAADHLCPQVGPGEQSAGRE